MQTRSFILSFGTKTLLLIRGRLVTFSLMCWKLASLTHTVSGDTQDRGLSPCRRSSWSRELLPELMRGHPSFRVSHFSFLLLGLMVEDGGPGFGATADTEESISEEAAAPKKGYGQNDDDERGEREGSCRKMFIKVSK